ncbi:MAG: hypothetical protein LV479_02855 [Methylacidiphilales bacterium]|nr:hypothetical protein [Candidatus Methylacidiphilales bacterium]
MTIPLLQGSIIIQALSIINLSVKIIATSGFHTHSSVAKMSGPCVKHFLIKLYSA